MSEYQSSNIVGHQGELALHHWPHPQPRFLALLVHGYGEHLGRYHHVAARLAAIGGYVAGPDHAGHGLSQGERVRIDDFAAVVDDLHLAVQALQAQLPALPLIVIGHSMGGMIATRYVQLHAADVTGLVLSGPLLGERTQITALCDLPQIPDLPLDITTLSRDPRVGEKYQADARVWQGPFKRPTLLAMRSMLTTIHHGPGFGALPVLWLHGAEDKLVRLEESRQTLDRLRGSDFDSESYPGAQHEIFNEINQDEVLDRVCGFIQRVVG